LVEVVVKTQTLVRSASGSITGEIFLRSSNEAFPDDRWSDFPVVILAWWIEGLNGLVVEKEKLYVGSFMDGPYAFVVEVGMGVAAQIAWGERSAEVAVGNINVKDLLRSAVTAGQCVVAACHAKGWSGTDLEGLEDALARCAT